MFARRLSELRSVAQELRRCTAKLHSIEKDLKQPRAAKHPHAHVSTAGVRHGAKDMTMRELSPTEAAQKQRELKSSLEAVRHKLLFRKIPIALSRFERSLVVPVGRRRQATQLNNQVLNGDAASKLLRSASSRESDALDIPGNAVVRSRPASSVINIVDEVGLQEARGPQWRITSGLRPSTIDSPPLFSTTHAFQILTLIRRLELERNTFFQSEIAGLRRQIAGVEYNIANRTGAITRGGGSETERRSVDSDAYILEEQSKLQQLQLARDSLQQSIVARPFVSAFLWKSLLQPDFLNALLAPAQISSFLAPTTPNSMHANHGKHTIAHALRPAASLCSLVLGIMATPQDINKMCPRFVVSLQQLSREMESDADVQDDDASGQESPQPRKPSVRWVPQRASSQLVPLTWLTIHALASVLSGAFGSAAARASSADDSALHEAKLESEVVDKIGDLCELVQGLQALCSSVLLLDRDLSPHKRQCILVAEGALLGAAHFILRNAPQCSKVISQDQACRLLTTLFRLHAVAPEKRESQVAVACLMARLFPILSSGSYGALSQKYQRQASGSIFANLTKKHRTHLRRKHSVTTASAASAVIANTIAEHRVQSRQMAAALKLRELTTFYESNLQVLAPHPLSTVALLFQIVCMTASASRVPPPAARLLISAGCLVGESLLGKLSSRPQVTFSSGPEAVEVEFERLTALVMAASTAVPVAREIVGLLPQESKHVSGEHFFMTQMLIHFLRCVAALAAEALRRADPNLPASAVKNHQPLDVHNSFPLKQYVYLFDAVSEVQGSQDMRRGEVSLKNQAKETLSLLKALLGIAPQSWWDNELRASPIANRGTDQMVPLSTRERYYNVIVTALRSYEIMDAPFEDNLAQTLRVR